jgi:hypothetical protein
MPSNVGAVDRLVRIVLGLGVLGLVFFGPKTSWGWVGLVPLATGLVGTCPLYTLIGISTRPASAR